MQASIDSWLSVIEKLDYIVCKYWTYYNQKRYCDKLSKPGSKFLFFVKQKLIFELKRVKYVKYSVCLFHKDLVFL